MRKIISTGIGLLALAAAIQPAAAADLPRKVPVLKAPPVYIDPWTWTGFYIGLNGGYSWGRSTTNVGFFTVPAGVPIVPPAGSITSADLKLNGGIFGGQIGYNWQFDRTWVFGLEADIQWSGEKDSTLFRCAVAPGGGPPGPCLPGLTFTPPGAAGGTTLAFDQRRQWFGTLRGRLGVLPSPTVLLYITGGLAYGELKTDLLLSGFTPFGVPVSVAASQKDTKAGWVVGGGIEGRLWDNWTGKLEYLYMDLGEASGSIINTAAGSGAPWSSSRFHDNILRAGINYKFGGPVIAKF